MYFTYCKTNVAIVLMMGVVILSSCAHKDKSPMTVKALLLSPLERAQTAYQQGEYFSARTQVQAVLDQDPENTSAQQLMADVLDKEIERQKETVILTSPDNNDKEVGSADDTRTIGSVAAGGGDRAASAAA